jgi:hypothetical protein
MRFLRPTGHSFRNAVVLVGVTGVTVNQLVDDGNLHMH